MKPSRKIPAGQDPLPFRNERGILAHALPWERMTLRSIGALFLVVSLLYMYFLVASIAHVAARQELSRTITSTQAAVATLEGEYLAKTEGLTQSYALSNGFVAVSNETFVERSDTVTLDR